MAGELEITVYDKGFQRVGFISAPESVTAVPRRNATAGATFTIPDDHEYLAEVSAPGAHVTVDYRLPDRVKRVMSGQPRQVAGVVGPRPSRTFAVTGHFSVLGSLLGWPNPAGTLAQQGVNGAYYTATGPAETVLKQVVAANASRLGLPLTVAADQGRGSTITASLRMHPTTDRLLPLVTQAGLVIEVNQGPTGLVLDVREPATYPRPVSVDSGVITGGTWSRTDPAATRVVLGLSGEKEARTFRQVIDTTLEAELGTILEVFRDARDIDVTQIGWEALADARGWETLTEAAAQYKLDLELADTDSFAYAVTYDVGDRVPLNLGPAAQTTEAVTAVSMAYTAADGLLIAPTVGEGSDEMDTYARAVAALARAYRDLTAGR